MIDDTLPGAVRSLDTLPERKPRKIALVGTAPSTAHVAPFDDPSWEIWGVAHVGEYVTRADRWYELHDMAQDQSGNLMTRDRKWVEEWRDMHHALPDGCEVWMLFPDSSFAREVKPLPANDLLAKFKTDFMTSSFAWMHAHALWEHDHGDTIAVIGLWGCDMEYGTEYENQRLGVRHFQQLAEDRGIEVVTPIVSGLAFEKLPYPLQQHDPLYRKIEFRRADVEARHKEAAKLLEESRNRVLTIDGILQGLGIEEQERDSKRGVLIAEREALGRRIVKLDRDNVWRDGVLKEQKWLLDFLR